MRFDSRLTVFAAALVLAVRVSSSARAGEDIPLKNWPVPGTGLPSKEAPALHGGLGNFTGAFFPIAPCRVVDTRGNGAPIQGGAFGPGEARTYSFGGRCSESGAPIPNAAMALSLNVTVTQAAGPGFLVAYPAGGPLPPVSTLNYVAGDTLANAAIVPSDGLTAAIAVVAGVSGTHVLIDVNGFFTSVFNPQTGFQISGNRAGSGVVSAHNSSPAAGSSGVSAYSGPGPNPQNATYGVVGVSEGGPFSAGVSGIGLGATSTAYGVIGDAGPIQTPSELGLALPPAGVLGRGTRLGLYGVANAPSGAASRGIVGCVKDAPGLSVLACGFIAQSDGLATYGLFSYGNTGASGAKSFVEPHPHDPNKVIRYVALEGPEAGTYFRGRARLRDGVAVIEVPESFRLVSDEEGLTVHLTPLRAALPLAVESVDLSRVVVRAPRDVEFFYVVHGVRKSFKGWEAIADGAEYRPAGLHETMPGFLAPEQRKALVKNGTYNEDGTVNRATAERAGWTRAWEVDAFARPK